MDYKIEEWKNLREEIARKQDLNYRIIFSTLALNFLLYSYLLVDKQNHAWIDAFIVLLPAVFVGISHYWHLKNEHSAFRIALYLRHFVENADPKTLDKSFSWEITLSKYINVALEKVRYKKSQIRPDSSSILDNVKQTMLSIWKAILDFCGRTLIKALFKKNNNEIPREVNFLLYPFYYISPTVAFFILIQDNVTFPPGYEKSSLNLFIAFLILGFLSFLIFLIWELTIIKIGNREIALLKQVSKDIDELTLNNWKTEIENWPQTRKMDKRLNIDGFPTGKHFWETIEVEAGKKKVWSKLKDINTWDNWNEWIQKAEINESFELHNEGEITLSKGGKLGFKIVELKEGKSYDLEIQLPLREKMTIRRILNKREGRLYLIQIIKFKGFVPHLFRKNFYAELGESKTSLKELKKLIET